MCQDLDISCRFRGYRDWEAIEWSGRRYAVSPTLVSQLMMVGNGEDVEEEGEGDGEDGDRPKTTRKVCLLAIMANL